jgi:hypothetical protein
LKKENPQTFLTRWVFVPRQKVAERRAGEQLLRSFSAYQDRPTEAWTEELLENVEKRLFREMLNEESG